MKLCCIIILSFFSRATTPISYQPPPHNRITNKADSLRIERAIKATFKKLLKKKILEP